MKTLRVVVKAANLNDDAGAHYYLFLLLYRPVMRIFLGLFGFFLFLLGL